MSTLHHNPEQQHRPFDHFAQATKPSIKDSLISELLSEPATTNSIVITLTNFILCYEWRHTLLHEWLFINMDLV
jgi:hypothetical protein